MMQNVLLVHQKLLFYRVPIYNKLNAFLRSRGFRLCVWYTDLAAEAETIQFKTIDIPMTCRNYAAILRERKVDIVIAFLNRRDVGILFYLFAVLYGRITGRKTVYYGHGLNLNRKRNPLEILISNLILLFFNRIVLYSPNEKRFLWRCNRRRATVAFNTLDLEGRDGLIAGSREDVKQRHGLTEEFIVLFSGRIEKRKRLDLLVEIFLENYRDRGDIGLVIVGPNMPEKLAAQINGVLNIHYVGPIYERRMISELFYASDVFCIPGHLGLGIVEALYWGLPVITMSDDHAPESYYLNDGVNSLTLRTKHEMVEAFDRFLCDRAYHAKMSDNARRTFFGQATLGKMLEGYTEALDRVSRPSRA